MPLFFSSLSYPHPPKTIDDDFVWWVAFSLFSPFTDPTHDWCIHQERGSLWHDFFSNCDSVFIFFGLSSIIIRSFLINLSINYIVPLFFTDCMRERRDVIQCSGTCRYNARIFFFFELSFSFPRTFFLFRSFFSHSDQNTYTSSHCWRGTRFLSFSPTGDSPSVSSLSKCTHNV